MQRETERDRERQRETERDRERQRATERDGDGEIVHSSGLIRSPGWLPPPHPVGGARAGSMWLGQSARALVLYQSSVSTWRGFEFNSVAWVVGKEVTGTCGPVQGDQGSRVQA